MTLDQQVCSLELAKRLKELGVKQESAFWWIDDMGTWKLGSNQQLAFLSKQVSEKKRRVMPEHYHAFTVAELGELLPKAVKTNEKQYRLTIGFRQMDEGYRPYCEYWWPSPARRDFRVGDGRVSGTEADARAKMLIYLLENKLIELPQ